MEAMFSYILMVNTTYDSIPHAAKIQPVMQNYFSAAKSAALVSNDPNAWNEVSFPFSLIITRLDRINNKIPVTDAFILDFRDGFDDSFIKQLNWRLGTKFLVLTVQEETKPVSEALISYGLCQSTVVSILVDNIAVTIPLDPCKGIGNYPAGKQLCRGNVSFMDFPPNIIFSEERLLGYEGLAVEAVADHLGIELSYINRHEVEWGHFDPPSGLEGDVATGRSLMGIGALFEFPERAEKGEIFVSCTSMQLSWAVPVGAGPVHPTWFIVLVSELSVTVWMSTLAVYLALIPISMLLDRKSENFTQWPFHNFALVLGSPQRLTQQKTFTISIVFFGFILTSYYQTMMSSKLTAPPKIPDISTMEELLKSGLTLTGPQNAGNILKTFANEGSDKVMERLSAGYHATNMDLTEALLKMAHNRNLAFFRHGHNMIYHAQRVSLLCQ